MKKLIALAVTLAMAAAFAVTASASEWNFYGSARMTTFVSDVDNPGANDTTTLNHTIQGNSRIGAKIKVNDAVDARFEYGTGVNVRILYGRWDFGAGNLLIGQTYTPANITYPGQAFNDDNGLANYGVMDVSRSPMVRLEVGNFVIAAIQPATDLLNAPAGSFTEVTFPKVEARYNFDLGAVKGRVAGGFNTFELTDSATGAAHDVDSYMIGIGTEIGFGDFYLNSGVFYGQNIGHYGGATSQAADPQISASTLIDNNSYGFNISMGYTLNDMFSFETGYGWQEAELDTAGSNEDDAQAYYVQSTITFAPGVFIVPEIGVQDEKQDATGAEEGETVYYGLKWQIDF